MAEATVPVMTPAAAVADPVAERIRQLRERAGSDPVGARDEAWEWIGELGERSRQRRGEAHAELRRLFACGEPADDVRGQTEGRLVAWTLHPLADRVLGSLTDAWLPWVGKAFTPEERRGANIVTRSGRLGAKLVWPLYTMQESPGGYSAFAFSTYVEAGRLDPSVQVLVIDYASVAENPRLVIRQIRDELIRIVPGAYLGRMLVNLPGRRDPRSGLFFALRSETRG